MGRCHIVEGSGVPTTAPLATGDHYIDVLNGTHYLSVGTSSPSDWLLVGQAGDVLVSVSGNDTTPGYIEDKLIVNNGTNTTNPLEATTLNDGSDEDYQIQFDESKVSITSSQVSDFTTSVQAAETDTTIQKIGNTLRYIGEDGTNQDIDLSLYLDDTNLARLVSGSINPATGIATFTRDDATTFTVDFSTLIDIETITTLVESPTGVFEYTSEDATKTTIDISGFETSTELDLRDTANRDRANHTGTQTASTISDFAAQVAIDETDTTISLIGNTLRYVGETGLNQDIDLSPYLDDTNLARIVSGLLNPTTGILTLTRDDATNFTIDLSALLDNQDASEVPVTPAGNISSTDVQAALEELQGDIDTLNATNFGEDNTASNVGVGGVGTFKQKTGVDLEFKNINAGSNKISITDDVANNEIDIDVNESNLTITSSQVSDFDTAVSNNTDVAANTSARHDAVTLGGVPGDTTDDTLDLLGQVVTVNLVTQTTDGAMSASDKTKLDGVEAGANNYIHPNHTGEVTSIGDGAQTVDKTAITNKTTITAESGDYVLVSDTDDTGNLKKVDLDDLIGGGHIIQEDGVSLPERSNLDFKAGFDIVDNAGADATEVNLNLSEVLLPASSASLKYNGPAFAMDLNSEVWTKITAFDAELEEGGTVINADTTTDRITIGADGQGKYVIDYSLTLSSGSSGLLSAAIYKNGLRQEASRAAVNGSNGQRDNLSAHCHLDLIENDYLELYIKSTANNQDPDINFACFTAFKPGNGAKGEKGDPGTGTTFNVQDEGVLVTGGPFSILDFSGTNVVVTDAGGGVARASFQGKAINLAWPSITNNSTSYAVAARFMFAGTGVVGVPQQIKALINVAATTADIRIYDVTNALVIAEKIGILTSAGYIIEDLGALNNLPVGEVILEVQMGKTGGGSNTLDALQINF